MTRFLVETGTLDLEKFLLAVDATYGSRIVPRDPEEILLR